MNLAGRRILVTGATGFVGRHLTRTLLDKGAQVTCLVRESSRRASLPAGVQVAQACLCTGQGLDEALAGQDAVIHLAALLFGLDWQQYLDSNARAAQCLAAALVRHDGQERQAALKMQDRQEMQGGSISRFVLVSSLAATGPSAVSPGVTDDSPPAPVSAYGWSKYITECVLGRALGERMVTLRPPIIYGSGDKGLLPYFTAAQKGLIIKPGVGRAFPVSAVHVYDMVQAILLALQPEARGVYHLNDGAEHTMVGIGRAIAAALHSADSATTTNGTQGGQKPHISARPPRVLPVPLPLMGAAACVAGLWGKVALRMGLRAPSWNPDKYREARQAGWLCSSARISHELGFIPAISLEQGMAEAVSGYRQEGWLS